MSAERISRFYCKISQINNKQIIPSPAQFSYLIPLKIPVDQRGTLGRKRLKARNKARNKVLAKYFAQIKRNNVSTFKA